MQDKNQNLLYFAYGEHMNEEEMKKLCPQARKVGMSALEGYTLCFFGRDGMGRAGLEAAPGRHVPGCVWVLPEAQAEQLDQEADCPYFARREIRTFSIGGMANEIFNILSVLLFFFRTGLGKKKSPVEADKRSVG